MEKKEHKLGQSTPHNTAPAHQVKPIYSSLFDFLFVKILGWLLGPEMCNHFLETLE